MNLKTEAFLSGLVTVLICLLPLQWYYSQLSISIAINHAGSNFWDAVFGIVTYMGDGWFVVVLSILIFFINRKLGLALLLSYLISSGLAQIAKHLLFSEWHRPMWFAFHQKIEGLRAIAGAEETYRNSFPSGHTTAAFSMFATFSFFAASSRVKLFCLFLAMLTAFSRIYLFQHFLRDTWAGSILGTSIAIVVYFGLLQLPIFQNIIYQHEHKNHS